MVQKICSTTEVQVIEGVTVDVKARVVTVKGARGTLTRDFKHLSVEITKDAKGLIKVLLRSWRDRGALRRAGGWRGGFRWRFWIVGAGSQRQWPCRKAMGNRCLGVSARACMGRRARRRRRCAGAPWVELLRLLPGFTGCSLGVRVSGRFGAWVCRGPGLLASRGSVCLAALTGRGHIRQGASLMQTVRGRFDSGMLDCTSSGLVSGRHKTPDWEGETSDS